MKKLFVILLILAAGLAYAALNHHFILFDDHLKILKKNNYSLQNTLVDGRGAKKLKLLLEPDLIQAGIKDLIGQTESYKIPTKPPAVSK
ncbi:MAG: hypothetical protein KKB20_17860 [Proteobacteria bacterium]|nr:hypothetical protein [Pseudomonadota bacterium]